MDAAPPRVKRALDQARAQRYLVQRLLVLDPSASAASRTARVRGKKRIMEDAGGRNLKLALWTLLSALLRAFGRITRRLFIALGLIAAPAVLGYAQFESIIETIDSHYSQQIDAYLGIDRNAIARLRDRAYFAQIGRAHV